MDGARTDPDETADVAPNTVGAAANNAALNAGAAGAGAAGAVAAGAVAPKVNAGAAGAAGGLGGHLARLPPRLRDAITLTRFQKLPSV